MHSPGSAARSSKRGAGCFGGASRYRTAVFRVLLLATTPFQSATEMGAIVAGGGCITGSTLFNPGRAWLAWNGGGAVSASKCLGAGEGGIPADRNRTQWN